MKYIQTKTVMIKTLKEYKRKLLKYIQAKLRQFLATEYRTPEEIQKENMDLYIAALDDIKLGDNSCYMSNTYAGDINYLTGKNGYSYYRNCRTTQWINSETGENIDEPDLMELLSK